MNWVQLLIDTDRQHTSQLEDWLLLIGASSVTFKERIPQGGEEQPILEPGLHETPLWEHTRIVGLFTGDTDTNTIDQQLSSLKLKPLSSRWEQLEDKDWEREWMQNYQPIQCTDNLWICPSWMTPPDPTAINLLLDPGLAFGTGTHPTTFLCLQWLATQDLASKTVVDYGCGSGILGIATLLLGAKRFTGVDLDPQALIATQENLSRNHLKSDLCYTCLPAECPDVQADYVIANILAAPLVELAELLIALIKPTGKLCLSGLLSHQAEEVMAAYSNAIIFDPVEQQGQWVRLTGEKQ